MTDNYLTGIEAQTDKNAFVLPGLGKRVAFKSDRNFQEKVDSQQQVILMPTEYGIEEYRERDIKIATLCKYDKVEKTEDGTFAVRFVGISLCLVKELRYDESSSSYFANVELLPEQPINQLNHDVRKLVETIQEEFKEYLKVSPNVGERTIQGIKNPTSIDRLVSDVTLGARFDNDVQRSLVNERDPLKRLQILSSGLETRIFEQEAEKGRDLVAYYKHKLSGLVVDAEVKKRIYLEMSRLKNLKTESSEYGNVIDWLDRILAFPWNTETEDNKDIKAASDILNNSFYSGEFEYPEGSGKVYEGAHKPLVKKALFEQIQSSRLLPLKAAWGTKNFAFKEIFKCGTCGASITAEEKFKHLLDGSINRHVYYHCTKKVDPDCPEKFVNEVDLKEQLLSFIAENTEKIEITDELARKALAHTVVVEAALQIRGIDDGQLDPMTEYSRYVLMKGSYKEQGALAQGINSRFVIRNKLLCVD